MFWLMDYLDYGYVAIDTRYVDETARDPTRPEVVAPQSCLFINEHNMIDFEDDIFIRRFYWESFDNLQTILGNECILTGNLFYIINDDPSNNIESVTNSYKFFTNKHQSVTLRQRGDTVQLRQKTTRRFVNYWLHRIVIDINQLNLSRWYYRSPIGNSRTYTNHRRVVKFAPQSESYIYDQNLSLLGTRLPQNVNHCVYDSFVQKLFDGTEYRFRNKYRFQDEKSNFSTVFNSDVQPIGSFSHSDTLKSFSSECSFIAEKIRLAYGISKINNVGLQYDTIVNMIRNTSNERTPGNCHTISTTIDNVPGIDQNSWKPIFYNFGDFILRPLFLSKYLYLLNMIHHQEYNALYTFGLQSQYTVQKIIDDFRTITGPVAKIPIYDEPQIHWGGDSLHERNLPRGEQQMNRVGRIWQFILNPIIVKKLVPDGLKIVTIPANFPVTEYINITSRPFSNVNLNNMPMDNQLTIDQLWVRIEKILKTTIDASLRSALIASGSNDYILLGGKGINNIISEGCLEKSFDFDIHLTNDKNYALEYFGQNVSNKLNQEINKIRQYRIYIFDILLNNNLVNNNNEYKMYYSEQKLFYFGSRISQNRENVITGLFIKLKLRDDILPPGVLSVSNDPRDNGIIYYPIADVEYESVLNFGLLINAAAQKTELNGIWYPKYVFLVFNLIRYVDKGGHKQANNLNKLRHFFAISRYSCRFVSMINERLLQEELDMIPNHRFSLVNDLIISNQIRYTARTDVKQIIIDLINAILHGRDNKSMSCRNSSILHKRNLGLALFQNTLTNDQKQMQIEACSTIALQNDIDGCVHLYTSGAYLVMNVYLQYDRLHIPVDNANLGALYGTQHDSIAGMVDISEQSIGQILENISTSIQRCNNAYNLSTIRRDLNDNFYVYRAQSHVLLDDPLNNTIFDTTFLVPGQRFVMYVPHFVSASFSQNYGYDAFIDNANFVLNIKINKNTRKWAILNEYSNFPAEKEILIDKNCVFLITGHRYQSIELSRGELAEKLVLNVTLYDNITDFLDRFDAETLDNFPTCEIKSGDLENNPRNIIGSVRGHVNARGGAMISTDNKIINLINFTDDQYDKLVKDAKNMINRSEYVFKNTHKHFVDFTKSNIDVQTRLQLYDLYQTYYKIPSNNQNLVSKDNTKERLNIKQNQLSFDKTDKILFAEHIDNNTKERSNINRNMDINRKIIDQENAKINNNTNRINTNLIGSASKKYLDNKNIYKSLKI